MALCGSVRTQPGPCTRIDTGTVRSSAFWMARASFCAGESSSTNCFTSLYRMFLRTCSRMPRRCTPRSRSVPSAPQSSRLMPLNRAMIQGAYTSLSHQYRRCALNVWPVTSAASGDMLSRTARCRLSYSFCTAASSRLTDRNMPCPASASRCLSSDVHRNSNSLRAPSQSDSSSMTTLTLVCTHDFARGTLPRLPVMPSLLVRSGSQSSFVSMVD